MFALKRPCNNCPFRKGAGRTFRLGRERVEGIFAAPAFQCHKTLDYSDEQPAAGEAPQQCAGLMAVLARAEKPNQIMQVASRLGRLEIAELDPDGAAYATMEEAMAEHDGGDG